MSLDYHPCSEERGVIPYPDKGMSLVLGGADKLVWHHLHMWSDCSLVLMQGLTMARP